MNIESTKSKIKEFKDDRIVVKVYLGRNKYEYYEGRISKIYPNIFVVETDKGIKSFTYSDVLTKTVSLKKY